MPNILQRLYKSVGDFIKVTPTPTAPANKITGYEQYGYSYLNNDVKKTEYLNELRGWVSACVTAIADEIASVELGLYSYKNGEVVEIDDSPIIDLLYKVNEYTTRFDHFWITMVYLELTGEAPWYIEKNGKNITGIYFLRPDRLMPVIDKSNKIISGYTYDVGMGKKVPLALDEVIFLKYPDPVNPLRGKGTLEMAARTVDVDNFSEEWNKNFYKNAAKPDSVLKVKTDNMSPEQKDLLKKSLREQYQGVEKAHKTMVLFGDMEWQQIGINPKEMDFLEQQKFSRDKILSIFRVPKAVVAQTEGVNFASAAVAQYAFARWCIKPKLERIVQQLNEFLIPMFDKSESLYLDYPNIVPDDETIKLAKYQNGLMYGWMTINEVRQAENLPPVDGGDSIYMSYSLAPIGGTATQETKELKVIKGKKKIATGRLYEIHARNKEYFNKEKEKNQLMKSVESVVIQRIKDKLKEKNKKEQPVEVVDEVKPHKFTTTEEKLAFWSTKDLLFRKYFPALRSAMGKVFEEQYKEVVGKLMRSKSLVAMKSGSSIYNKIKLSAKKEEKRILGATITILEDLFKESGDKTFEAMGIDMSMSPKRDDVQKLIISQGKKFAKSSVETTNGDIEKIVYENVSNGGTVSDLKTTLGGLFDDAEQYRADRIARTETVRYSTAASEQAYIDSGVVEAKEWFVNPDACELCQPMAGKTVDLGDTFFDVGDSIDLPGGKTFSIDYEDVGSPPLHVNCQCDLVPVFIEAKSINKKPVLNKILVNKIKKNK
jgi:HK97 family phage portal protein